jgi:hypothetical protein
LKDLLARFCLRNVGVEQKARDHDRPDEQHRRGETETFG